jgi:hypothetical protein
MSWEEWEIPREAGEGWPETAKVLHAEWWRQRIARQQEIDASIAAKAEFEYLYDKPYVDNRKVRVSGPFTVESISPHRVLGVDENGGLIDPLARAAAESGQDFAQIILENLKTAGVQQAHKEDKIVFTALTPWPGDLVCAEGTYDEGGSEKRAGGFIGPEFGTVSRPDLVAAAREAGDAGFDVLVACAFNYDARLRLCGLPREDMAVEEDGCHGRSQVAPVEKSSSSFAALIATPVNIPFRAWGPLAGARRATVRPWRVISISSPRSTSSSNANSLAFTSVAVIRLVIWSVSQPTSVGRYRDGVTPGNKRAAPQKRELGLKHQPGEAARPRSA